MSECCDSPSVKYDSYNPGEVRLYGHPGIQNPVAPAAGAGAKKSADADSGVIRFSVTSKNGDKYAIEISDPATVKHLRSLGVIYGYAYEGHCYKLPKPIIMLLPELPSKYAVDGDCGYKKELEYHVWIIDQLARVVIVDVRSDTVKTLVLDANTPGNRSPLAYSQTQALAPQRSYD